MRAAMLRSTEYGVPGLAIPPRRLVIFAMQRGCVGNAGSRALCSCKNSPINYIKRRLGRSFFRRVGLRQPDKAYRGRKTMSEMISIRGLTKSFGSIRAVDDVSFAVARGEVLGFLGPNGAGKSTTMKMITGFLTPTSGTAVVCGHDVARAARRGQAPHRLPARGRARLSRHDAGRLPRLHRARARLPRRRAQEADRARRRPRPAARSAPPADRHALEGLQAPRRPRAGDPARSRRAHPRRADRRPRPQPEARGARR